MGNIPRCEARWTQHSNPDRQEASPRKGRRQEIVQERGRRFLYVQGVGDGCQPQQSRFLRQSGSEKGEDVQGVAGLELVGQSELLTARRRGRERITFRGLSTASEERGGRRVPNLARAASSYATAVAGSSSAEANLLLPSSVTYTYWSGARARRSASWRVSWTRIVS